MYLNARLLRAALGVQGMFLPTPVGGASIEWVNSVLPLFSFFLPLCVFGMLFVVYVVSSECYSIHVFAPKSHI